MDEWNRTLSDVDQDHKLNQEEFIIAMYFINARLKVKHEGEKVLPWY